MLPRILLACCSFLLSVTPLTSTADNGSMEPTKEELEDWFESDNSESASHVNEGELTFLTRLTDAKPVHHHQNKVSITADTIRTGWVKLTQCHENLDQVSRLQITFRPGYVRDMQVSEQHNVAEAWVEGHTVQLRDIGAEARICLQAHTQALKDNGNGFFGLANGPYMRKFLDGYYPMRVSMHISYPEELLQVVNVSPESQPGFVIEEKSGGLSFDATFEGELRTLIRFQQTQSASR